MGELYNLPAEQVKAGHRHSSSGVQPEGARTKSWVGQQSILSWIGTPGRSALNYRSAPISWGSTLLGVYLGPIGCRDLCYIQDLSYE